VPGRIVYPLVHAVLFLGAVVAWFLMLGIGVAIVLIVAQVPLDVLGSDPTKAVFQLLGAGGAGVLTAVQTIGLGAIAAALCLVLPAPSEVPPRVLPANAATVGERLRSGLALRGCHPAWVVAAAIGGLTVWTFPTWLADRMLTLFPDSHSAIEMVSELLAQSTGLGRVAIVFAIVVTAPIFEELVFRGYLWRLVSMIAPGWVALVVTTLLFAAFHMDAVQSTALLPTALFLGWLRLRSGSILPGIVAHFVNNGVGALSGILATTEATDSLPLVWAVAGAAFTVAVSAAAALVVRRSPPPAATV